MRGALTPERAKLMSKGVKSVESRIALLKDALPKGTGVKELRQSIRKHLCKGSISLTEEDVKRIREIESGYYVPSFLWGKTRKAEPSHHCWARIEGCGTLAIGFDTKEDKVMAVALSGDYFELGDAHAVFNNAFAGCPFTKEALAKHAAEHIPNRAIRGLGTAELCSLLDKLFE
jgi:lipoic acid synthetase/lipoate-protein ligase A